MTCSSSGTATRKNIHMELHIFGGTATTIKCCVVLTIQLYFNQEKYKAVASGRSKKDARNAAAKGLIQQLDMSTLPQV